jgi:hypothetical protein
MALAGNKKAPERSTEGSQIYTSDSLRAELGEEHRQLHDEPRAARPDASFLIDWAGKTGLVSKLLNRR